MNLCQILHNLQEVELFMYYAPITTINVVKSVYTSFSCHKDPLRRYRVCVMTFRTTPHQQCASKYLSYVRVPSLSCFLSFPIFRFFKLTLGAHAQRGLLQLGLCVCLSVTLNFTSRVFVRLTKDTTYLTGDEGQNDRAVFSENAYGVKKANMQIRQGSL